LQMLTGESMHLPPRRLDALICGGFRFLATQFMPPFSFARSFVYRPNCGRHDHFAS
jgi:hypothetical protein